jgi:O-antigen/teichoic acid export membrane protein
MAEPSPSTLRRNILLNLLGHGLPLAAALVAVPLLLQGLGPDRFGVVALAMTLVTLVGFFDLGFGRAMTQALAARIGRGDEESAGALVGTTAVVTAVLGAVLAVALVVVAPFVAFRLLQIPDWLQVETLAGLKIIALAVPAVLVANCLRGVAEAHQRFGALSILRAVVGSALLLVPVVVLRVDPTIPPIMWSFVGIRWFALVGFLFVARASVPLRWTVEGGAALILARLGGWMTVSTVMASLMIYADRFVIGGLLSMSAVAYYVAPFEVIARLSVVPVAVMGVLFPAFSQLIAARDHRLFGAYRRAMWTIGAFLAMPVLVIVVFSKPLLSLWLGPEVAEASAPVASILAVGALVHSLVQPSFQLLQAAGRPAIPAIFQTIESPVYAIYLIGLTISYGIVGTACAWLIRVTLSLVVQSALAHRFVLAPLALERSSS